MMTRTWTWTRSWTNSRDEDEAEDEHEDKLLQRETISAAPLAGHPLTVNLGGGQQFGGQPICSTVNKQFGQQSTTKI